MPLFRSAIPGNKTVTEAKLADSLSGILAFRTGALTQYSLTRVGADGKTLGDSAYSDTGTFAIIDRELRVRPGGVGAERMRVTTTGISLGLVTKSPAAALHVRSDGVQTNLFRFALDGSNRLVGIMASNGNIYQVLTGTSPTFRFGQALAVGANVAPAAMIEGRSTSTPQSQDSYSGSVYRRTTVDSGGLATNNSTGGHDMQYAGTSRWKSTSAGQAWFGATPRAQDTSWSVTGYTAGSKTLVPGTSDLTTTQNVLANLLALLNASSGFGFLTGTFTPA